MENIAIIIVLLVMLAFAVKETVKHFKGESACCGGASKAKKKKLKNKVINKYTLKIGGMHCKHCVSTVTAVINDFDGAAGRVSLRKGEAVVLCDREIDIEEMKEKIRRRGYEVL